MRLFFKEHWMAVTKPVVSKKTTLKKEASEEIIKNQCKIFHVKIMKSVIPDITGTPQFLRIAGFTFST